MDRSSIEASLKQLDEHCTDISSVGNEEGATGKKLGDSSIKKDDRVTWDGQTSIVKGTTAILSSATRTTIPTARRGGSYSTMPK